MKKVIKFFVLFILIFFTIDSTALAADYKTLNNNRLNGGVGNYGYNKRYYYITSSASSYTSQIVAAMSDWIYTTDRVGITTPISFRKTNTQSSSVMDLHAGTYKSYPWNGANGWTEFFRYGNSVNPFIENWGWGKITLNNYNMSSKSSSQKKGVVAHEMGHVFGLDDNNTNTQTVMCQEIGGPAVTSAQKGDLKGINYLY